MIMFSHFSQSFQNICSLVPPVSEPPALDDIQDMDGIMLFSAARINLDVNFITALTATAVDSFSFVFVAYTDRNGNSFLSGVSSYIFFISSRLHTVFLILV